MPCSLFFLPYSLFPVPCSLKPETLYLTKLKTAIQAIMNIQAFILIYSIKYSRLSLIFANSFTRRKCEMI
ncbi:MAG: hypothetical protein F6J90_36270 [Moorea sp. SIOASIH]|uniref:hypothetical protein n=1 Tax=Moorena sp. SIOASIH TaxID=2607817 RepID=UPI0013BB1E54|nr:hypothetical protein [Moorena sp. SIOASIH]NEO41493.1 hypothetical protein [Moorena sp. SIOASIH]